jgi:hypothetical protein
VVFHIRTDTEGSTSSLKYHDTSVVSGCLLKSGFEALIEGRSHSVKTFGTV